eukprot:420252-Pelagomonas_calceolata.AAC.1
MVQEAMTNVFMLCFVLQFSASTVIEALQCFKKGNRRCSLVSAHVNMRCRLHCLAQISINRKHRKHTLAKESRTGGVYI